jgi:outer membrane receptor for ferrienterochelin and colicins
MLRSRKTGGGGWRWVAPTAVAWAMVADGGRVFAADELPADDLPVENIEELSLEALLDAPITAASRYEENANLAPGSVSTMNAEEIERFGFRSLAEVLRAMRGVYTTNDRTYDYLGVNGFGLPGDYNVRVLVMVDGHRINDSVFDSALVGLDGPVDVEMIERVEYVRGPSSSVYGSNALFGVVNVITKSGAQHSGVKAIVQGGGFTDHRRYDNARITLRGGHLFESGVDVYAQAGFSHSRGVEHLGFSEFPGQTASNLDAEKYLHAFARATWRGFRLSVLSQQRSKQDPSASFGTAFDVQGTKSEDSRAWAALSYHGRFDPSGISLSSNLYFDRYTYDGDFPQPTVVGESPIVNRDEIVGLSTGGDFQANKNLVENTGAIDRLRLSAGGDVQERFSLVQKNFDVGTTDVYSDRDDSVQILGAYGILDAQILKTFHLSAGLRFDRWSGFSSTWNPRLSAIWTPASRTTIKLIYGAAFRGANAYERFYEANVNLPNPGLKPERIRTGEIVGEQYLGDNLRGSVSIYQYEMDGLIAIGEPTPGVFQNNNLPVVEARGASVELEARWDSGLRARGSYALQSVRNTDASLIKDSLANSPQHIGKVHAQIPLWSDRLYAAVEGLYLSERQTPQSLKDPTVATVPGYVLTNLTLTYALNDATRLSLASRNLLNTSYADPGSDFHTQNAIPQNGRSVWLRASYVY